jgi:hypothetical protein
MEDLIYLLIKLARALIWPLEDFYCLTHVHAFSLLPSCLLILLKLLVILVIIRVSMGFLLGELALTIGLGI